jgi:multisubunit Na+/H+ antiporter MnhB subunit
MTEIIAFMCGVAGTLLLALKGKYAGWGFVAFLASNVGWILFAIANRHAWLLGQHLVFMATSLIGIYTWLVRPYLRTFVKHYSIARKYSSRRRALSNAWLFTRLLP